MAMKQQLESALEQVEHAGKRGFFEAARQYLQLVREQKVRDSEHVVLLGSQLLRQHRHRFREEELWLVTEQVAVAALDTRAFELAIELVRDVKKKFPDSQRTVRLTEMYFEARGQYDEAERVITEQLEEAPESQMLLKRQVALEKSKGNTAAAIELLRKYVDVFQTDKEAWEELGELYLQVQMYPQAATCYEEVLLQNPASIAAYVQYADVLYTIGGASNYRTARTYYAAAVDLSNGENTRALYGLCATSAQLTSSKEGSKGKDVPSTKDVEELAVLAGKTLLRRYGDEAPDRVPLVLATLKAQGFAES